MKKIVQFSRINAHFSAGKTESKKLAKQEKKLYSSNNLLKANVHVLIFHFLSLTLLFRFQKERKASTLK